MRWTLFLLAVFTIGLAGCKPSTEPLDDAASTITATIVGQVSGDDGMPISSAAVSGYGTTTMTNDRGVFILRNVVVPRTRSVVTVRKSGYFTGARAVVPNPNGGTPMRITLQTLGTAQTFSATTGGAVAVGDASVAIPGSAIVTAVGTAYSGIVRAYVRYQDPTRPNFYDSFSGDMSARRTDGSTVELYSYGVLRVVLQGTSGEALNLAPGSAATLRFPAVDATESSVPLWHFDETQGIWVEEGSATRQGGFYVGTVTHFTDWNLDRPDSRVAFIEGRVTCGENTPLTGLPVRVGQRRAITDDQGVYRARVPADVAFTVEVNDTLLDISTPAVPVSGIAEGSTRTLDINAPCPASVTVRILDCNDQPTSGIVYLNSPGSRVIVATTTGNAVTLVVPKGRPFTLSGHTYDGRTFDDVDVPALTAGQQYNAGDVRACSGVVTPFVDVPLPGFQGVTGMALSSDGSMVVVVSRGGAQSTVRAVTVATGATRWELTMPMPGQGNDNYPTAALRFVASDTRIGIVWRGGCAVLDAATGTVIREFSEASSVFDVSADGQRLLALRTPGDRLTTYAVESGAELGTVTLATPVAMATSMRATSDGLVTIQSFRQRVADYIIVDPATGAIVREETSGSSGFGAPSGTRLTLIGNSWSSALFSGLTTGRCYVRRLRDSSTIADVPISGSAIMAYALAEDERTLLYGQSNMTVAIVQLDSPTTRRVLPIPASGTGFVSASMNAVTSDASFVSCLVFGPQEQPSIRVWDLR